MIAKEALFDIISSETKGRCCVATKPIKAKNEILCSRPDIAVLYTPFTTSICARCFQDEKGATEKGVFSCAIDV